MIELKHLKKSFDTVTPLKDVNVVINDGDVISIIGPSGCGKSTLLKCISLLEMPTAGEIWIDGKKINTHSQSEVLQLHRKIGMVFQSFNLFENLTAIENVMVPQIEILKRSKKEAYNRAVTLLEKIGLSEKAFDYPDTLSGGQKQRVAIARTLAMDTDVILFDEPTSALDPTMVNEVLIVINQLSKMGKTMMIVTHEMNFARKICNRVFYLDEGGVYEDGTPEQIFEHPQKEKTKRFIRHANVLELLLESEKFDYPKCITDIYQYGYKYGVPQERCHYIASIFEELCQNILIAELIKRKEAIKIKVIIENITGSDDVRINVRYCGNINPENTENTLALTLLKGRTQSLTYTALSSPNEEYTDEMEMIVK